MEIDGLPVVVADDDFVEFLYEQGYDATIDIAELDFEYKEWAKENVSDEFSHCGRSKVDVVLVIPSLLVPETLRECHFKDLDTAEFKSAWSKRTNIISKT